MLEEQESARSCTVVNKMTLSKFLVHHVTLHVKRASTVDVLLWPLPGAHLTQWCVSLPVELSSVFFVAVVGWGPQRSSWGHGLPVHGADGPSHGWPYANSESSSFSNHSQAQFQLVYFYHQGCFFKSLSLFILLCLVIHLQLYYQECTPRVCSECISQWELFTADKGCSRPTALVWAARQADKVW